MPSLVKQILFRWAFSHFVLVQLGRYIQLYLVLIPLTQFQSQLHTTTTTHAAS